jgi:hypothetical protein
LVHEDSPERTIVEERIQAENAIMSAERHASTASALRRKSVAEEPVTSVLAPGEVPVYDREFNADEEVLAALGYVYALCHPSDGGE